MGRNAPRQGFDLMIDACRISSNQMGKRERVAMGNYISETLIEGESVTYEAKLHWVIFVSWRSVFTLFVHPILERLSTEFAVTNKRVIWKQGIVRRRTGEMTLGKIENVQVEQGIAGRIFNYGTVALVGTGGTRESFDLISTPLRFRKAILQEQDEMDHAERPSGTRLL
jgi:uncharacterized membrane protein YdbT with pleckstrin-like domain